MSDFVLPLHAIETLVQQVARSYTIQGVGYRPTTNQLLFFLLVWVSKKGNSSDLVSKEDAVAIQVQTIARHLAQWGETVSALRGQYTTGMINRTRAQRYEQEWELLRIQLQKAATITAQKYGRADLLDHAVSTALLNVFTMLQKLVDSEVLESTNNIVAFVQHEQGDTFRSAYDFSSPFYAYARRIVKYSD
ncbi:MAG: hypothetical protein R3E79_36295 [Caldilineaceae bacterium]